MVDGNMVGIFKIGLKTGYQKVLGKQGDISRAPFPEANLSACSVYRVNPWKPMTVYCHRAHAELCKDMMTRKFNREPSFMNRPGMYDMLFLPNQEKANVGWQKVKVNQVSTLNKLRQKHLTITGSLVVLTTDMLQTLTPAWC